MKTRFLGSFAELCPTSREGICHCPSGCLGWKASRAGQISVLIVFKSGLRSDVRVVFLSYRQFVSGIAAYDLRPSDGEWHGSHVKFYHE